MDMKLEQYQSALRFTGVFVGGSLTGIIFTLMVMQYQGKLELRFTHQETYIMIDGKQDVHK
jgi:hypothetical protein